jgi:hypothetical protein
VVSDLNDDMQYVTRKALREELAPIHAVLKFIVERMVTKDDLAAAIAASEARTHAAIAASEARTHAAIGSAIGSAIAASEERTRAAIAATEGRLLEELGRHTRASAEETRALIRVLDDKYADVHPRLAALEAKPPRPERRARRRTG